MVCNNRLVPVVPAQAVIMDRLKSARDPRDRISAITELKVRTSQTRPDALPCRQALIHNPRSSMPQALSHTNAVKVAKQALPRVLDLLRARHLRQLDDGTAQQLLELLKELLENPTGGREVLTLFLSDAGALDALLDLLEGTATFTAVLTLQVSNAYYWCCGTTDLPYTGEAIRPRACSARFEGGW
jgi:hypothetical protein